jgi:hypothetical protein
MASVDRNAVIMIIPEGDGALGSLVKHMIFVKGKLACSDEITAEACELLPVSSVNSMTSASFGVNLCK